MPIRKKILATIAAATGAAAGAGLLPAVAQVIGDPKGQVCVATAGETCYASAVAISRNGSAWESCTPLVPAGPLTFSCPNGVTVGWSGASGGWVAVAPQGQADGFLAVGNHDSGNNFDCGAQGEVAVSWKGCAAGSLVGVSVYGEAESRNGAAISAFGPADGGPWWFNGTEYLFSAPLAISGTGTATGSVAVSGTGPANATYGSGRPVAGQNIYTPPLAAVSGTKDATGGPVAVSGTGNAFACGGPGNKAIAISGTGLVFDNTSSTTCQPPGPIPIPGG